jgi:hypothetical protein
MKSSHKRERSDSIPQRQSPTKISTTQQRQTRPTKRNFIPQHVWKEIFDMSGYHTEMMEKEKKEMLILAEAVCCFQGTRSMWIPLLSADPSSSRLWIGVDPYSLQMYGNVDRTLSAKLSVPDMAVFFKIILRYEIDVVEFTKKYGERSDKWALDGECIKLYLKPNTKQPHQNNLQLFIKYLISEKRKLSPAEVDFYNIICAQPLVKRSDENKKYMLSLKRRQFKGYKDDIRMI